MTLLSAKDYLKSIGLSDGREKMASKFKLTPAADYLSYLRGDPGSDGLNGKDGKDGRDGKVGPQGPAGTAGRDGAGFNWKGHWLESVSYNTHDVVNYLGSTYVALSPTRGSYPNRIGNEWDLMAASGASGANGRDGRDGTDGIDYISTGQIAQEVIYVREASDLSGTLDSSKLYFIDGQVDMGTTSIVVPEGGLNMRGHGFGISGLFSTANSFDLFVTNGTTYSGDLFLTEMDIRISGTNSRVFFLDNQQNFNAVEWNTVNFIACTDLGEITAYRQGLNRNVAWISCKKGITMSGTWAGGWAAVDSIVVGAPMTDALFKAGTALVIDGSFRSNLNILGIGASGGLFCDFAPSNITLDSGFLLDGVRGNPAVNNLPNMPPSSTKALIRNCVGLQNTYVGAAIQPNADSTITISAADTLYQITNAVTLVEDFWFSTANTNGLRSDSTQTIDVVVSGTMSFTGSNNRVMAVQLRRWDNSASAYVNIGPEYETTLNGGTAGTRAENISFSATTQMDQDDRVEVWVKNLTDTTDITVAAGGQIQVFER